jgi:ABC-2 type transport system ATP-binding protein
MKYAIECRGAGKTYPHFNLDDIDLCVPEGSVMGFVGPNGAGKSTTLRIIMGLVHPDRGSVNVLGHEMPREQIAAKWDIGFVSEDMRLYPGQTIDFHMGMLASIFPSWDAPYAAKLLQRFDLKGAQKVRGLSHGQRVKACLLMVLARRPRLLVFDEPTTGLDPQARRQILEEMTAVLADEQRSILFSSHNTLDIEQISDQITFIAKGSILFSEDKETLLDNWRRIRLEVPDGFDVPPTPGLVDVQRSGHLAILTTNAYSAQGDDLLRSAGATVNAVERMTLEEIFLASVNDPQEVPA